MDLVVATRNKKKLQEIKYLLKGLKLKISSLKDYPHLPKIEEDGKTFSENAIKKALVIAKATKKLTLGEDSGLEVKTLAGRPGVYSSRFAGPAQDDLKNNLKLLRLLKDTPFKRRKAQYRCAIALADREGLIGIVEGSCSGLIGFKMKGSFGFGYDPLFIIPRYKKTFAELGPEIKHRMSHRFKALVKARKLFFKYIKYHKTLV